MAQRRAGRSWPGACPCVTRAAPIVFVTAMMLCFGCSARASDAPLKETVVRPKIGLVLSGGGARGATHIGVLRVLEQMHIPIDYIAGTSMGSIIGGLYASGMTPEEIEQAYKQIDWNHIFDDNPARQDRSFRRKRDDDLYVNEATVGFNNGKVELPTGIVQGQKFDLEMRKLTPWVASVTNFDDLPTPFRAVATNIQTGKAVVLGGGDIVRAMRASMAVPGIFAAVTIQGKTLVDGGISDNLPIDVVRRMGADIIIAVDIGTPLNPNQKMDNLLSITGQLVGILTTRNVLQQKETLSKTDVLIVPHLGKLTSTDFTKGDEFIAAGLKAAIQARPELRRLEVSDEVYRQYLQARHRKAYQPPIIQFVDISNNSGVSDSVIREKISQNMGAPLDVRRLEKDIGNIYGLELFENVNYRLVRRNGQTGIDVVAKGRRWGPNYLQFGMVLSGNWRGDNDYNFGLGYLKTAINSLDGEVRIATQLGSAPILGVDWYQPLDPKARFFVEPTVRFARQNVGLFSPDGKKQLAEYRVSEYVAQLAGGVNFGAYGEFRLGVYRARGQVDLNVGEPTLPTGSFDTGSLFGQIWVDRLNNAYFPTAGHSEKVRYTAFRKSLGDDGNLDQVDVLAQAYHSFGRNTLGIGGRYRATVDGEAAVQDRFFMGGFLNLSGYTRDALSGQNSALLATLYYRRIGDSTLVPLYVGASLEYGNVWEKQSDMSFGSAIFAGSLFFGANTPLGPLYIGYGQAEHGRKAGFLYLGKTFP